MQAKTDKALEPSHLSLHLGFCYLHLGRRLAGELILWRNCMVSFSISPIPIDRPPPKTNEKIKKRQAKITPTEQLVLFAIGENERYGLAIQDAIKACSNGEITLSIGSLYPTLQKLESKELVTSRPGSEVSSQRCDRKRRYFRLSDAGKTVLADVLAFQKRLLSWDK